MGSWTCGRGVKTVVQKEESSVCLSGNSYCTQPQQACVRGGDSFVWAPPLNVLCPMVKTLGVNCNCEVPSLNLSETTFGNALTHSVCSHSTPLRNLRCHVHLTVRSFLFFISSYSAKPDFKDCSERGSPVEPEFALEETDDFKDSWKCFFL